MPSSAGGLREPATARGVWLQHLLGSLQTVSGKLEPTRPEMCLYLDARELLWMPVPAGSARLSQALLLPRLTCSWLCPQVASLWADGVSRMPSAPRVSAGLGLHPQSSSTVDRVHSPGTKPRRRC